ncbi:hypothetical protein [Paenibacillus sacheonensis]|uniref:Uncharacterized protein n=1 Tax=Paenibacillus sacheonensis TaxID=742054 RepID=A0A7X4YPU9_9BACL|nr:hypothetical protein [Paenibacillus sacheonensis]MBM7566146.1 hypothetical protein [Paenibacillus sacheonensis]NBC70357.1 hypothetical protein [Paenibacillus sacheonensis]
MIESTDLGNKANVLREFEVYGYQVAYYLLEDEALAEQAALRALSELFTDNEFFRTSTYIQKQKTKQVCIKHSLLTRSQYPDRAATHG